MKRSNGHIAVHDDEWYTPRATADAVAAWLARRLPPDVHLLCPCDVLPDGRESTIPQALRAAGFRSVRVTRALPMDPLFSDWRSGEVIVTNPPFSLLVPFREFVSFVRVRFCVLARFGALHNCYTIPALGSHFVSSDGRGVCAAWFQNIADTIPSKIESPAIGNCENCERATCRHWQPGVPRPLYGAAEAVKNGLGAWFCADYTVRGARAFNRYFDPRIQLQSALGHGRWPSAACAAGGVFSVAN